MKDERALLSELGKVRRAPQGKRVLHLFCSWAAEDGDFSRKRADAVRQVQKALANASEGEVYGLANGDVIAIYSQLSSASVMAMSAQVQANVLGNRLPRRNIYNEVNFFRIFDASREIDRLIDGIRTMVSSREERPAEQARQPIDVEHYNKLAETLRKADIRSLIFNQPVYFTGHETPSIDFLEFYVAVSKLEEAFCPNHSLTANPWLFNLVKHEMDAALMRAVQTEIADYRHRAFSINAQVTTFFSEGFRAFVESLPTKLAGKLYVELDKADIIQHSDQMPQIAQRSKDLSVPICIDGLSFHDLRFLKLSNVAADTLKIKWSMEMAAMSIEDIKAFVGEIRANSDRKIVLTRCDSPKALAFAKTVGMDFIQGRLADKFFRMGASMSGAA
jgi:EAL domain-containing protein (putative c-di-GMP-specific phosphodiesterase class I)